MQVDDLIALVADLRHEGSDSAFVEVKRAHGGFPDSLLPTLSAFANTPGGGTVVLGLDERSGFAAVGVPDPVTCRQTLATKCRQALDPPVTVDSWALSFEGTTLVVAQVQDLPAEARPCRVRATGKAYLRSYDGDYVLSQVEEQAFLANRTMPDHDRRPVPGTGPDDLDRVLLHGYLATCRESSTTLAGFTDDEILFRTGVTTGPERQLSLAGLLALGSYPQQHVPNCVVQASVTPRAGDPEDTRAIDPRRFDGPVPTILDDALAWVRRNTVTRVRFTDGEGRDAPGFPVEAVRELLSNALVHRDLGPHALTRAVTLRLDGHQLVISNPGGLWGITVDRLGTTGVSSARNGHLLRICQNVRSARGTRVVEALASGIPTVLASLHRAGMVPPRFHDQGIGFTVTVPDHTLLAADDLDWLASLPAATGLDDRQRHALVALRHGGTWTNRSLREAFPMDSREAHLSLTGLVEAGLAVPEGERGGRSYRLAPMPEPAGTPAPAAAPPPREDAVVAALQRGPASAAELVAATGLTPRQLTYRLRKLREAGVVAMAGRPGRRDTRYHLLR